MAITMIQIEAFILVLARVMGIFIQAPVFNSRSIPAPLKMALAVWVTALLMFVVPVTQPLPDQAFGFIAAVIIELFIGALIGFVCFIFFTAVQSGGEIADVQMGLSVANVLDPSLGGQTTIVGRMIFYLALMLFLAVNGHHMILSALHQSFSVLPLAHPIKITSEFAPFLFSLISDFWAIAIQLAAPIILLLLLSDFTFGLVSRVAPQVNVFMLGFQVKPSLGLFGLLITMPLWVSHIAGLISRMGENVLKLLYILR